VPKFSSKFSKTDAGRQLSQLVDRVNEDEKATEWQTAVLRARVEQRVF
jgi:hypothetical protein